MSATQEKPFDHPRWEDSPFVSVPEDEERAIIEEAVKNGTLPTSMLDRFREDADSTQD